MKQQENREFQYQSIVSLGVSVAKIYALDTKFWVDKVYEFRSLNPQSVFKSNRQGWQSNDNLHTINSFTPLVNIIKQKIQLYISSFNFHITQMWVNISPHGAYNSTHTHSPSHIFKNSGVFYLKTPKNCGNLIFNNPLDINTTNSLTPEESLIVLFDSRLPHSTDPNLSQEDRISIAFNFD